MVQRMVQVIAVVALLTGVPGIAAADGPQPPQRVRVIETTYTTATLAWDAPSGGRSVFSYEIREDDVMQRIVPGDVTTKTIDNLTPGSEYRLTVVARDRSTALSQPSEEVVVTTLDRPEDSAPPSAPADLRVVRTGANNVSLAWSAAQDDVGIASYQILDGGKPVATAAGVEGAVNGLKSGSTHEFSVVAKDFAGKSSAPSVPLAVVTKAGADQVGAASTLAISDDIPWGLAFLPDQSALFSERDTFRIYRVTQLGTKTFVGTVPDVVSVFGEDGVLGLAVAPTFPVDRWVYIFHSTASDNRIVRIRYENGSLNAASKQVVLTGIPHARNHNGGRLRFGPDGKLYASTGENQVPDLAQDLNSLGGKILRLNPNGTVPSDNPFPGKHVFSYGHRNSQGLAFDSRGRLWAVEFGHREADELNLIKPGGNYGWPYCEGKCGLPDHRFIDPVRTWRPSQASPSGITIVNDTIFIAAQRGARLYRTTITGSTTTTPQQFFVGHYGRVRTVETSPTGDLWLTATNGDILHKPGGDANPIVRIRLR